jgi:NitT/TauT family transport system ATP-binding protein
MSLKQIQLKNLWKEYGTRVVLENISLEVQRGEFVSIVGASGCGKTTFFKMLLGEEQPTRGSMQLEGRPWPKEPGADRGVVFQRYSVFPHLSALGNVLLAIELREAKFSGHLFGSARRTAVERAQQMLASVGLDQALQRYPHELSGGMQQRLALAQSLICEPQILLLDEPFGALDPGIRSDMHALLLSLWREKQFTVFMVTHDIKEGFSLGTRVLVFDKLRKDPQAPDAYGATISFDLDASRKETSRKRA